MVEKILHAAMYAPSAVNKQPWHFIVFDNIDLRKAIMKFHRSAGMLTEAKKCILVCFDENLQHDAGYGIIDCAAATQNILLAAHGLGLGACWIGIQPRQERIAAFHELFQLPDTIVPFSLISLGFPAEEKATPDRMRPERIHFGTW
jgi:nitroreductase